MKITGTIRAGSLAAVLLLAASACSDSGKTSEKGASTTTAVGSQAGEAVPAATVPEPGVPGLEPDLAQRTAAALPAAGAYAEANLGEADPASLAFYDYMWRNWQVPGLEGARAAAEAAPVADEPRYAIFQRLVEPDAELPEKPTEGDVSAIEYEGMTVALHCDQTPTPKDFVQMLDAETVDTDVSKLAHAAYAVGWVRELGCKAAGIEDLAEALTGKLLAELGEETAVDDNTLQASVALSYLGRADLIQPGWYEAVLAAQKPDGGWSEQADGEDSSWHTTGLAIWTLAAATGPGAGQPMITAAA